MASSSSLFGNAGVNFLIGDEASKHILSKELFKETVALEYFQHIRVLLRRFSCAWVATSECLVRPQQV